jgi:RimJ/RimL family protein N-acetyltransferase
VFARVIGDAEGPTPRLLPDLPGGELSDDVVVLRPLTAADADDTYGLRSLDDVVASSVPPRRPDRATVGQQCARSPSEWLAGQRADFTIRDRRTGAYAGEIGFYYWEASTQQAMIGYSIRPEWRGMGYAKRAARLVSQWGFDAVGVARVVAGTAPDNVGSQRVLERAGFIREGYQRARLPGPDGTRIDDLLYARLNPQLRA